MDSSKLEELRHILVKMCDDASKKTWEMFKIVPDDKDGKYNNKEIPINSLYFEKNKTEVYLIEGYIVFKSGVLSNWSLIDLTIPTNLKQSKPGKLSKLETPKLDELSELPMLTKRACDVDFNPSKIKRVRFSDGHYDNELVELAERSKLSELVNQVEPVKLEEHKECVEPVFYSVTHEFVYRKATMEKYRFNDPKNPEKIQKAEENNPKIAKKILECRCPKELQKLGHELIINIEEWDADSSTILEECMRKKFEHPLYKTILEFAAVNNLRIIEGQPDAKYGCGLYFNPYKPEHLNPENWTGKNELSKIFDNLIVKICK